jgi:hypothetical protein
LETELDKEQWRPGFDDAWPIAASVLWDFLTSQQQQAFLPVLVRDDEVLAFDQFTLACVAAGYGQYVALLLPYQGAAPAAVLQRFVPELIRRVFQPHAPALVQPLDAAQLATIRIQAFVTVVSPGETLLQHVWRALTPAQRDFFRQPVTTVAGRV